MKTAELVLLTGLTKLPVADSHPKCRCSPLFALDCKLQRADCLSLFGLVFPRAQCLDPS